MSNPGILSAIIWPTYVGLAHATDPTLLQEPIGDSDYDRGQITWRTLTDGAILGRGRVYVPKGGYSHIVFATGPIENILGLKQLEHPIVFDRSGYVDIDPIRNQDYLPREACHAI